MTTLRPLNRLPFGTSRPVSRSVRLSVVNLIGGGGRGMPGGGRRPGGGRGGGEEGLYLGPSSPGAGRQPQKLIIPGQKLTGNTPAGQKLVLPDADGKLPAITGGVLSDEDTITTLTGPGSYRPPPGFMNEEINEDITVNLTADMMLQRLRSRAGQWHQLAKFIPALYKQGIESNIVDELTGITPVEQNRWAVASTVYDSLEADGKIGPEVLEHFQSMNGAGLLHPFRFLTNNARNTAAQYIYEKTLDDTMCEVLAKAMKEYERRVQEHEGFTKHPGDCLSFKYMRDALEGRKPDDIVAMTKKALKVAVSDSARKRLNEIISIYTESEAPEVTASLLMLRITVDEIGQRPIALLGNLGEVLDSDVEAAPRTTQDGPFASFAVTGSLKYRWVVLPQWKALAMSRHPVAMEIADMSGVEAILQGTKVKSEDDKKRLKGPGLLVADRTTTPSDQLNPDTFYLATLPGSSKVSFVDGLTLQKKGATACATVLFVCRPPVRDGNDTNSMLQM